VLTPGEVRIERDAKTGAILKVIRDQDERSNPLNDPLNDIEDDQEEEGTDGRYVDNGVIRALEEQATMEVKKRPRQQSQREEEWIEALVEKYGDDYGKMMRDRRLNPMQQSEGDLKRRVKRWQQSRSG
jgi:nucleolar protein 16